MTDFQTESILRPYGTTFLHSPGFTFTGFDTKSWQASLPEAWALVLNGSARDLGDIESRRILWSCVVASDCSSFLFLKYLYIFVWSCLALREVLLGFHESCHKFEMLAGIDILDLREWTKKRQQEDRICWRSNYSYPGDLWGMNKFRRYRIYWYMDFGTFFFCGIPWVTSSQLLMKDRNWGASAQSSLCRIQTASQRWTTLQSLIWISPARMEKGRAALKPHRPTTVLLLDRAKQRIDVFAWRWLNNGSVIRPAFLLVDLVLIDNPWFVAFKAREYCQYYPFGAWFPLLQVPKTESIRWPRASKKHYVSHLCMSFVPEGCCRSCSWNANAVSFTFGDIWRVKHAAWWNVGRPRLWLSRRSLIR